MRPLLPILCLSLLLVACEKEELVRQDTAEQKESLNKNGPPSQSGPYVIRGEDFFYNLGAILIDEKAGLTATFAVDNAAFCAGAGLSAFDVIPFKNILSPSREGRIIQLLEGTVRTEVYEGIYTGGFLCDFFAAAPLIAAGTSDFHYNDNDVFTFLDNTTRNANAYQLKADGTLTGANGEPVDFRAHLNGVWDGVNPESTKEHTRIMLK